MELEVGKLYRYKKRGLERDGDVVLMLAAKQDIEWGRPTDNWRVTYLSDGEIWDKISVYAPSLEEVTTP